VFPLIKVSPINLHMRHLLLGGGGVFFGVSSFCVSYYGSGPRITMLANASSKLLLAACLLVCNNGVLHSFVGSVARQRPVSNTREVFPLGSVPRTVCNGKIVLLVRQELQDDEDGRSRHA
jgi:hypothetical protein